MFQIILLWKFSSDDQTEPISNEGLVSSSAKKTSNSDRTTAFSVEKFVDTEILDSATVDKNGTTILSLGLTVLQPGKILVANFIRKGSKFWHFQESFR